MLIIPMVKTSHFQISNLRFWVDEIRKSMKNRKEYDVQSLYNDFYTEKGVNSCLKKPAKGSFLPRPKNL